ncbi:hypothetical protein [Nonlabens sp.]|uniref:hypothetical protein n=1 Tax=Nonlabens sp. TaxID=1888209 RepID=UPI003F6A0BC6
MKVTVHYKRQVILGLSFGYVQIVKNGKPMKVVQRSEKIFLDFKEGDVVQFKMGLMKSNEIKINETHSNLYVQLSKSLRYAGVGIFFFIILNPIITSVIEFEKTMVFIYFGLIVFLFAMWATWMLKGKHLKIVETT